MKKTLAFAVVSSCLLLSQVLPAQIIPTTPSTGLCIDEKANLGRTMKKMDAILKTVKVSYTDAAAKPVNIDSLHQLQLLIMQARLADVSRLPTITSLPVSDQPAAKVQYKAQLSDLLRQTMALEEALEVDDLVAAKNALSAMKVLETDGHDQFQP